jgi:hypothetical protein
MARVCAKSNSRHHISPRLLPAAKRRALRGRNQRYNLTASFKTGDGGAKRGLSTHQHVYKHPLISGWQDVFHTFERIFSHWDASLGTSPEGALLGTAFPARDMAVQGSVENSDWSASRGCVTIHRWWLTPYGTPWFAVSRPVETLATTDAGLVGRSGEPNDQRSTGAGAGRIGI